MKKNSLKKWFVIYTKSRNELRVTERLSCIGIEVYTPTRSRGPTMVGSEEKNNSAFVAFYGISMSKRE